MDVVASFLTPHGLACQRSPRLTQAELAEQAAIGKRTAERIEAGRGA
jgi:hypothetical protein